MQFISILQNSSLERIAHSKKSYANIPTAEEEMADDVFEFACRSIVVKSLPGWMEEAFAEQMESVRPDSGPADQPSVAWCGFRPSLLKSCSALSPRL
jgi:hypothetical protein